MVKDQILAKVKDLKLTDRVKELQSRLQKWKAYLPSSKTKEQDPQ